MVKQNNAHALEFIAVLCHNVINVILATNKVQKYSKIFIIINITFFSDVTHFYSVIISIICIP